MNIYNSVLLFSLLPLPHHWLMLKMRKLDLTYMLYLLRLLLKHRTDAMLVLWVWGQNKHLLKRKTPVSLADFRTLKCDKATHSNQTSTFDGTEEVFRWRDNQDLVRAPWETGHMGWAQGWQEVTNCVF